MGYKIRQENVTVTLAPPYDEGDNRVEVTGVKSVKWKTLSEIALLSQKSDEEKAAQYLPKIEQWLRGWLRGWNIQNDDGTPMPLDQLPELPSNLVIAIFNAMATNLTGATQLPPEPSATSTPG